MLRANYVVEQHFRSIMQRRNVNTLWICSALTHPHLSDLNI